MVLKHFSLLFLIITLISCKHYPHSNSDVSKKEVFDEQFRFIDEDGNPIPNLPFTIRLKDDESKTFHIVTVFREPTVRLELGWIIEGYTDDEGKTCRIVTDGPQYLEVYVGHSNSDMSEWKP